MDVTHAGPVQHAGQLTDSIDNSVIASPDDSKISVEVTVLVTEEVGPDVIAVNLQDPPTHKRIGLDGRPPQRSKNNEVVTINRPPRTHEQAPTCRNNRKTRTTVNYNYPTPTLAAPENRLLNMSPFKNPTKLSSPPCVNERLNAQMSLRVPM